MADDDVAEGVDAQVVAPRPDSVREPMRSPLALAGSTIVGFAMGAAEVVPGFSGGTVALVCGVYERLIANIRQGARVLSLAARGRFAAAWRALLVFEWLFVGALLIGMACAIALLAGVLSVLIEQQPVAMSAVFLGLVLGAAAVASGQLKQPRSYHTVISFLVGAGVFAALGLTAGAVSRPTLPLLFVSVAVAACAWILPGVSGAFLLLVAGLYPAVLAAVDQRDIVAVMVMALGALTGLAAFSTLLNYVLARFHDIVLAAMLGLLIGSTRVLWPWPSTDGMGDPTLGAPEPGTLALVVALTLGSFAVVWIIGLVTTRMAGRPDASDG